MKHYEVLNKDGAVIILVREYGGLCSFVGDLFTDEYNNIQDQNLTELVVNGIASGKVDKWDLIKSIDDAFTGYPAIIEVSRGDSDVIDIRIRKSVDDLVGNYVNIPIASTDSWGIVTYAHANRKLVDVITCGRREPVTVSISDIIGCSTAHSTILSSVFTDDYTVLVSDLDVYVLERMMKKNLYRLYQIIRPTVNEDEVHPKDLGIVAYPYQLPCLRHPNWDSGKYVAVDTISDIGTAVDNLDKYINVAKEILGSDEPRFVVKDTICSDMISQHEIFHDDLKNILFY